MKKKEIESDGKICVMGLGYVGLTLAVTLADVGFDVYGIEIRDDILEKLKNGEAHFYEPKLNEKLKKVIKKNRFCFFEHIPSDKTMDVFIITVGTPLGKDGKPRMDMIQHVTEEIAANIKPGNLVIMRSTLKLGITRNLVMPILEQTGKEFDLAFCPERTLEGNAMQELRYLPQIVGGISEKSTIRAAQVFQHITPTVVKVSNVETAEMIKLIDNTQRDVIFAFSNEVGKICNELNVSAIEVINAGKLSYPRTNLPIPGPVGGPCLEKDPYILMEGLVDFNVDTPIIRSGRLTNEDQPRDVGKFLLSYFNSLKPSGPKMKISLLGIAFKGNPPTDDLRGTMAKPIFQQMKYFFPEAEFHGYDYVVDKKEIKDFGLIVSSDLEDAFDSASIVMILNNHSIFKNMNIEGLSEKMLKPGIIYDFWNFFTPGEIEISSKISYISYGSHKFCVNIYSKNES